MEDTLNLTQNSPDTTRTRRDYKGEAKILRERLRDCAAIFEAIRGLVDNPELTNGTLRQRIRVNLWAAENRTTPIGALPEGEE